MTQSQPHSRLHLGQTADGVALEAEVLIDPTVDPLDRGPGGVRTVPLRGVPGYRREDPAIRLERHPDDPAVQSAHLPQLGVAPQLPQQRLHRRVLEHDAGDHCVPQSADRVIVTPVAPTLLQGPDHRLVRDVLED